MAGYCPRLVSLLTSPAVDCDLLLLKVASMFLVDQDQVQIVPGGELFVDYGKERVKSRPSDKQSEFVVSAVNEIHI